MESLQTDAGGNTVETLRQSLIAANIQPRKICSERSALVVEGYPRSGNSFLVSVMSELMQERMPLSHHTHRAENLLIADALKIPTVVLVREPIAAITSISIFSNRPVDFWAERYVEFYSVIDQLQNPFLLLRFDEVIGDTAMVLRQVSAFAPHLRLRGTLSDAIERASEKTKARAAHRFGDQAERKIGRPDAQREELKKAVSEEVRAFLADNPDALNVYRSVVGFDGAQA